MPELNRIFYVQLDEACTRRKDGGGIAGPMLLLSVWSWDRLPVGRPKEVGFNRWSEYDGNPLRRPTWAYKWDVVSEAYSDVDVMYVQYTNELDALTPEQVNICLAYGARSLFSLYECSKSFYFVICFRLCGSLMGPGRIWGTYMLLS